MRTRLVCGLVAVCLMCVGWGRSSEAQAAAPVPCTNIGGGKYQCDWWRVGDGISHGAIVVNGGRVVGYLHRGANWILCQARGGTVANAGGSRNNWYGWTVADNGATGWASALDARGGEDFGQFGGVPVCDGSHGPPPQASGVWETAPPGPGAVPPPSGVTAPVPGSPSINWTYRAGYRIWLHPWADWCTGAFVVRVGRKILGLTAGHCAPIETAVSWIRGPRDLVRLGTMRLNADDERPDPDDVIDVAAFSMDSTARVRWAREVNRGSGLPPVALQSSVATIADTHAGLAVCYYGATTRQELCGTVDDRGVRRTPNGYRLICTNIPSEPGNSGAPVYAYPDGKGGGPGPVRAVGILHGSFPGAMCFVPIELALRALGASRTLPSPGR